MKTANDMSTRPESKWWHIPVALVILVNDFWQAHHL